MQKHPKPNSVRIYSIKHKIRITMAHKEIKTTFIDVEGKTHTLDELKLETNIDYWFDIEDYPYYKISQRGLIKSTTRKVTNGSHLKTVKGRVWSGCMMGRYLAVGLCNDNGSKTFLIHHIMADIFLGHKNRSKKIIIDHKDNVQTNNLLGNLQIITARENTTKDMSGFSSDYIGVTYIKRTNKWVARISIELKLRHIGYYIIEEEARDAYQDALKDWLDNGITPAERKLINKSKNLI